ncbi:CREB-binding protein [Taenia solium]|eukprot:TsM_000732200 transcript=TsM_000732200 gene=TsM_000732200
MENLEVIPGVFTNIDDSDVVVRTLALKEQLRLLVHVEWCLTLRTPPTICVDPHCFKIRNAYHHMENCTAGVNCKLPQCAPAKQLVLHFHSCEEQQCPVCEPTRYALEKRFYPIEREGEHTSREFTLTREQRCAIIRAMTLHTLAAPDLSDLHSPALRHAIQCAKYFEDDVYTKATAADQYRYPIEHYVASHGWP